MKQALGLFGAATLLVSIPLTAVAQIGQPSPDLAEQFAAEVDPEIISGALVDYYPLALNNVEGFDFLLTITNINDFAGSVEICVVPAGSTQLQCTAGIVLPARGTLFLSAGFGPLSMLANTTGQIFIFAGPNTFAFSTSFILDQGGQGLTEVRPYQLQF
jgi:hypothetical protein